MIYYVAPVFFAVCLVLLLVGTVGRMYVALYVLNALWFAGALFSAFLTFLAFKDCGYSENWAFFGVLFFVWPYAGFIVVMGGTELLLLRKKPGAHVRNNRFAAIGIMFMMTLLSLWALAFN